MKREKTAVEFLMMVLQEEFPKQMRDIYESNQLLAEQIAIQAKQMEKEQIESAFLDGYKNGHYNGMMYDIDEDLYESKISDPKQYYQSKYGKDENKAENNG